MLRIRLSMGGVRKRPIYKIVVADGRYPRDGKFIEKLGSYNPLLPKDKKERIKVEFERVKYWISKGAQPTLRVSRILGEMQLMPMPKPGNNPLKAIPKKERKRKLRKNQKQKLKRNNQKQKLKRNNQKQKLRRNNQKQKLKRNNQKQKLRRNNQKGTRNNQKQKNLKRNNQKQKLKRKNQKPSKEINLCLK